jgi:hypothetical protein
VGVDEGTKETFRVVSGAGQFFYNVGFGAARLPPVKNWVGRGAGDVNAVGSATSALVQTAAAQRIVEVFGDIG